MKNIVIRKAHLADLKTLKLLADAHRHELGFVLRPALANSINQGEVLVADNNAGPIGFVEFHHRLDEQTTIYHIVVELEHRKQGVGRQLINSLITEAHQRDKAFIQLKCPVDLSANDFYACLGFTRVATETGSSRPLTVWRLSLDP